MVLFGLRTRFFPFEIINGIEAPAFRKWTVHMFSGWKENKYQKMSSLSLRKQFQRSKNWSQFVIQ